MLSSNMASITSDSPLCGQTSVIRFGRPSITVVVPAFNEEAYIASCLEALKNQRFYLPFDVIVVDNASTDKTPEIVGQYSCTLLRTTIRNQLLAKSTGVKAAKGETVAILDADCIPPPDWLGNIHKAMQDGDCVAVTCGYRFADLPLWGRTYVFLVQRVLFGIYRTVLRTMPLVIGGNVAFRRDCCTRQGGYPILGGIAETELGFARRLNRCGRIRYAPDMEVSSSSRRFSRGIFYFLWNYKIAQYFAPYFLRRIDTILSKSRLRE